MSWGGRETPRVDNWEAPLVALAAECERRDCGFKFAPRVQVGFYTIEVLHLGPKPFSDSFHGRTRAEALSKALHDLAGSQPANIFEAPTPGQRMQCWCGWRGVLDQVAEHEKTPGYHRAVMAP